MSNERLSKSRNCIRPEIDDDRELVGDKNKLGRDKE
jgi:hypothetical protein